jgi:uncharacterized iron-regulated protein
MNRTILFALITVVTFSGGCTASEKAISQRFLDLNSQTERTDDEVIAQLKKDRLVLVGEHHTNERHHRAQLQVIRLLHEAGVKVAIGMEMFRRESQNELDGWISGKLDEGSFEKIYNNNWTYSYSFYRPILVYARDNRIPVIGLNVPSDITRQVARMGYQSLSDDQRGYLGDVACRVDKEYMAFIREAFGGHTHGNINFIHFCEAQMVWDTVMAVTALNYLSQNPKTVMVILAGTGHVRKQAIPSQVRSRSDLSFTVILPEAPGSIDKTTVDNEDADYILLNPR